MRLLIITNTLWVICFCVPLNAILVAVNQPCNKDRDTLLLEDPQGNGEAFLHCNGVGVGTIGFWEKKICPNRMLFDFVNQQCRADTRRRKSDYQPFSIAILNSSCANGERCIGGTFCDSETRKCQCPAGTIPEPESLSCVQHGNNFKYTQLPNQYGQSQMSSTKVLQPNPILSAVDRQKQHQTDRNSFMQQSRSSVIEPLPLPAAVSPGSSCANGEKCGGGSVCTYPMKICLCPGELEDYGGECVMPKIGTSKSIIKVGIGAACGALAECDFDSSCVDGKCQCLPPLMEHEGHCFLRRPVKEVGPGELCDNGQVCTRGSVCDAVIPVCVCPPEWDLSGDWCVRSYKKYIPVMSIEQSLTSESPTSTTHQIVQPQPIVEVAALTSRPPYNQYTNTPMTAVESTNLHNQNVNSYMQYGGSKQAGVGENCSVNTDCMIGAYCKGNTVPATCQCLSTHVNVNGRCEKVIYPGQTGCQYDLQCITAFTGTKCINKECVCPTGYKAVEQTCVSGILYPGNACNNTSELTVCSARSVCINSVCQCVQPLMTNYRMQCIKKKKLHRTTMKSTDLFKKCASLSDCNEETICKNGHCEKAPMTINNSKIKNIYTEQSTRQTRMEHHIKKLNDNTTDNRRQKRKFTVSNMDCWPDQYFCANGSGICLDEKCHCLDGYRRVNDRCEKDYLPLNAYCGAENSVMECELGTECIKNKCVCVSKSRCLDAKRSKAARLTDNEHQEFCLSDEDCGIGLSCINSFCRCSEGFVRQGKDCLRITGSYKPVQSKCNDGDHCIAGSKCINYICTCANGSLNVGGKCHQKPSGSCADGQVCTGGARCELAICRCPPGTHYENEECVAQIAMPGESCEMHKKCTGQSLCRFGRCMCYAGYRLFGKNCIKIRETSSDLTLVVEPQRQTNVEIITNTTVCNLEIYQNLTSGIGGCCDEVVICSGNAICVENRCICEKHAKLVNGNCEYSYMSQPIIRVAESLKLEQKIPGATCRLSIECPYRTDCIRGLCRCRRGDTIINNVCRKAVNAVLPGSRCSFQEGLDCVGESHCINGKCVCRMGLKQNDNECVSQLFGIKSLPGESCGEGQICTKGSLCIDNSCRCRDVETISATGDCILITAVEEKLNHLSPQSSSKNWKKEQGTDNHINHYLTANHMSINIFNEDLSQFLSSGKAMTMIKNKAKCNEECKGSKYCTFDMCICLDDFNDISCIISEENDKNFLEKMQTLERIVSGMQGGTMTPSDSSKSGKNIITNAKSPAMQQNLVDVFILPGYPGGPCTYDGTCINNAKCRDGNCKCDEEFININGVCRLAIVPIGAECEIKEQCTYNATCSQSRCQCNRGFIRNVDVCISVQDFVQMCDNAEECTVDATCSTNSNGIDICKCPTGFTYKNGLCAYSPGDECYANSHCPNNRICNSGYCICAEGYQEVDNDCIESTPTPDSSMPTFPRTNFESHSRSIDNEYDENNVETQVNAYHPSTVSAVENDNEGRNQYSSNSIKSKWLENTIDYDNSFLPQPYSIAHPVGLNSNYYTFQLPSYATPVSSNSLLWENGFLPNNPSNNFHSLLPFNVVPYHFPAHGSKIVNKTSLQKYSDNIGTAKFLENAETDEMNCSERSVDGKCIQKTETTVPRWKTAHSSNKLIIKRERLPLQSCNGDYSCGGNSYCSYYSDLEPVCICPVSTVLLNGKCIALGKVRMFSKIGQFCNTTEECSGEATCVRHKCICPDGYEQINNYCIQTAVPGQYCDERTICSKGSLCDQRIQSCVCDSGTFSIRNYCVPAAGIERSNIHPKYCETRESCPENSFCSVEKVCKCFNGFRRVGDFCISYEFVRYPGEGCNEKHTCARSSQCVNGICTCINGHSPIFFSCHTEYIRFRPLWQLAMFKALALVKRDAEQVISGQRITAPQSFVEQLLQHFCKSGLCSSALCQRSPNDTDILHCQTVMLQLRNYSSMLSKRSVDENVNSKFCAKKNDCNLGQVCANGICVCTSGKVFINTLNICLPPNTGKYIVERCFGLLQHCPYKLNCSRDIHNIDGSKQNSCIFKGNEELTVPPGGSCYNAEQCTGGSICHDGWCICPDPSMIVNRGLCIKPSSQQPQNTAATYSTAEPFYPLTEPSSYKTTETYASLTRRPSTPTSSSDIHTTMQNSRNNIIVRKAVPGTNCGPLDECVGGSMCIEGTCICPPGYTPSETTARCEPITTSTAKPSESVASWITAKSTERNSFVTPKRTSLLYSKVTTQSPQTVMLSSVTNLNRYVEYNRITTPEQSSGSTSTADECAAVGLYCRGGTVCINMSCQCPSGFILHNDRCVPSSVGIKRRGKSWSQGKRFAKPNEPCRNGETCTGGSYCTDKKVEHTFDIFNNRKTCLCPAEKPLVKDNICIRQEPITQSRKAGPGEQCDSFTHCTDRSVCYQGMCRCQSGYIAISGKCVELATTPSPSRTSAQQTTVGVAPGERCNENRLCRGGSNCVDGICRCTDDQVIINGNCVIPTSTSLATTPYRQGYSANASNSITSSATTTHVSSEKVDYLLTQSPHGNNDCKEDADCNDNRICIVGNCRCKSGYIERNGVCIDIGEIDYSDHHLASPAPFASAQRRSNSVLQRAAEEQQKTSRPRITGPPLKRPRPAGNNGKKTSGNVKNALRTRTGNGICPPGNEPARDEATGKVIVCNGIEPNCPPRSYCYVTGYASEDYNCCKSW